MKTTSFLQAQAVRLAQSGSIDKSSWITARKKGLMVNNERFWAELRGDVILLYPASEILRQFKRFLHHRHSSETESFGQNMLERKQEHMKPEKYAHVICAFSTLVPKAKVEPIFFRLCKKEVRFETRTIAFTAYSPSTIFPQKTIALCFDTIEGLMRWKDVVCEVPEIHKKTLSDFSLIRHIGHGATSEVFLVRDRFSHKKMAMKAIEKKEALRYNDSIRRIIDERIVHSRMSKHPYILEMSHAFETSDRLYVATEYCSRGDLSHYLRDNSGGTASLETVNMVAAEILLSLEALHDQGIWYRDLKPENVMVADNGHVKLGDFGAAKVTNPKRPVPLSRSMVGTVEYLAPEMARDEPYSRTVDIWAFGIFICELLNGETPYEGETEKLTYENIKNSPLVLPLAMPMEARDLVRRLLNRNPNERLGCGVNGWEAVKAHPFFSGIDWQQLLLQPSLKGPFGAEEKSLSSQLEVEDPVDNRSRAIAFDMKRDYEQTKKVRYAGINVELDFGQSNRVPKHKLWTPRKMRRALGAYACGERSSKPLSEEPDESLSIPDAKSGSTRSARSATDPATEGFQQARSKPPLFRYNREPGFWRKVVSSLKFWRRR